MFTADVNIYSASSPSAGRKKTEVLDKLGAVVQVEEFRFPQANRNCADKNGIFYNPQDANITGGAAVYVPTPTQYKCDVPTQGGG